MSGQEHRAYTRFLLRTGSCVLAGEGAGAIHDLSLGGMFISYPGAFPEGTTFNIELRLGDQEIPAKAVVRRCVPGKGMGIEFVEMPAPVRARLKMFLMEQVGDKARVVMPPPE